MWEHPQDKEECAQILSDLASTADLSSPSQRFEPDLSETRSTLPSPLFPTGSWQHGWAGCPQPLGTLGQVMCSLRVGGKETEHMRMLFKGPQVGGRRQEDGQMEIRYYEGLFTDIAFPLNITTTNSYH